MMASTSRTNATQTTNQTQTPSVPSWITDPLQQQTANISALSNVPATSYVAPQGALQQQANQQGADTLSGTNPNYTAGSNTIAANSNVGPGQISNFMDPYTQNVLTSSNAQFDQNSGVQNAQLEAQGAASGAFGGSRFGVAQGVLGGQQALARGQLDSNILSSGYQSAVTNALNNANLGVNAGAAQGNIGSQQSASNIANIAALAGLGNSQQQTAQAQATAPIALAQAQGGLLSQLPINSYTGQNLTGTGTSTGSSSSMDPLGWFKAISGLFAGGGSSAASGVASFIPGG
jgi:hypothetical protein